MVIVGVNLSRLQLQDWYVQGSKLHGPSVELTDLRSVTLAASFCASAGSVCSRRRLGGH